VINFKHGMWTARKDSKTPIDFGSGRSRLNVTVTKNKLSFPQRNSKRYYAIKSKLGM